MARLVAGGMSNRQVASELFVSVETVQFHLTHIHAKVGVGSRAELAARLRDDTAADVATRRRGPRDFVRVGHGPDSHDPPATGAGRLVTGRRAT